MPAGSETSVGHSRSELPGSQSAVAAMMKTPPLQLRCDPALAKWLGAKQALCDQLVSNLLCSAGLYIEVNDRLLWRVDPDAWRSK